jgi:hypothetical protein
LTAEREARFDSRSAYRVTDNDIRLWPLRAKTLRSSAPTIVNESSLTLSVTSIAIREKYFVRIYRLRYNYT